MSHEREKKRVSRLVQSKSDISIDGKTFHSVDFRGKCNVRCDDDD